MKICYDCKWYDYLPMYGTPRCIHPSNIIIKYYPEYKQKDVKQECNKINKNNDCKNFDQYQKTLTDKIIDKLDKIVLG